MGVAKNWVSFLGSLFEGSHCFGSILGAPDVWKLPYRDDKGSLLMGYQVVRGFDHDPSGRMDLKGSFRQPSGL